MWAWIPAINVGLIKSSQDLAVGLINCIQNATGQPIDLEVHMLRPLDWRRGFCFWMLFHVSAVMGQWMAQGPGPTLFGQVENIDGDNPVVGAIHTVAAHPTDPNVLFVGGTNGGIWRTSNAFSSSPNWTPLIDDQSSLSIGALEFDPLDVTGNTLIAGNGRYSSYGRAGGGRDGLLMTSDGGDTWMRPIGNDQLVGKNISGVASRGDTIVVSVNTANDFTFPNIGIYRSIDGGSSFTHVSQGDGGLTGLPGGAAYDLVGDPGNPEVLYTGMVFSDGVGGEEGIYKSTDTGASWTKVSDPIIDSIVSGNTSNLELSVGGSGEVYAAVVNNGRADGIFRSSNGDAGTWVELDLPVTNENGMDVGLNPGGGKGPGPGSPAEEIAGGQGTIHFAIRADPTNPNLVYVGGDRQPSPFPNSIGAVDFTGRLFRGDASQPSGDQFVHLTHSSSLGAPGGGTASGSSPHADSREMVFDAAGRLVEVDDGGIYVRTRPQDNTGDWFSLIGDIQTTELHDIAYDSLSNRIVGGAQDTGTPLQPTAGSTTWESISTADGGDVAVDSTSTPNRSFVYSSFQFLFGFRKSTFDQDGNLLSANFPALTPVGGSPGLEAQFTNPIELNKINPQSIVFGAANGIFESFDQGETIRRISSETVNATLTGNALTYGGRSGGVNNPSLIYAGVGDDVRMRMTAGGAVSRVNSYNGGTIRDLIPNSEAWEELYVIDRDEVRFSPDTVSNAAFQDITGDLGTSDLWTVEFVRLPSAADVVLVGGDDGVFFTMTNDRGTWFELGDESLPNMLVFDLVYNAEDDILIAGTLGRGAWTFENVTATFLSDLNRDGAVDCADVDALVSTIVDGSNDTAFDLNGDRIVDVDDLTAWREYAGVILTDSGNPILLGDANLNGDVDASDFNIWNANKFSFEAGWCGGDFNADGASDASDFNLWNSHKFTSANDVASVPEPTGGLAIWISLIGYWMMPGRRDCRVEL